VTASALSVMWLAGDVMPAPPAVKLAPAAGALITTRGGVGEDVRVSGALC